MLAPATREAPLFGLVLCGGESQRMGSDKALLPLEGRSLLERAIACLEPVCEEVWLGSGPSPRYVALGHRELLDRRKRGSGPLAALEAGLFELRARGRGGYLALLACDMPGASTALVRELARRAQSEDLDRCALAGERGLEPLCAVYSDALLESVRAALDAGDPRMSAIEGFPARHAALPRCATLASADPLVFRNLNTPAELEAARAWAPPMHASRAWSSPCSRASRACARSSRRRSPRARAR
ncbi:MAG: molybdenum cofactor guanylyltransferase [Planctomycetes bacterium]|nr:molybdenum cofactor guanylyltransferase [Planctomycetota bacterium]